MHLYTYPYFNSLDPLLSRIPPPLYIGCTFARSSCFSCWSATCYEYPPTPKSGGLKKGFVLEAKFNEEINGWVAKGKKQKPTW